jgi:hypothetical protein
MEREKKKLIEEREAQRLQRYITPGARTVVNSNVTGMNSQSAVSRRPQSQAASTRSEQLTKRVPDSKLSNVTKADRPGFNDSNIPDTARSGLGIKTKSEEVFRSDENRDLASDGAISLGGAPQYRLDSQSALQNFAAKKQIFEGRTASVNQQPVQAIDTEGLPLTSYQAKQYNQPMERQLSGYQHGERQPNRFSDMQPSQEHRAKPEQAKSQHSRVDELGTGWSSRTTDPLMRQFYRQDENELAQRQFSESPGKQQSPRLEPGLGQQPYKGFSSDSFNSQLPSGGQGRQQRLPSSGSNNWQEVVLASYGNQLWQQNVPQTGYSNHPLQRNISSTTYNNAPVQLGSSSFGSSSQPFHASIVSSHDSNHPENSESLNDQPVHPLRQNSSATSHSRLLSHEGSNFPSYSSQSVRQEVQSGNSNWMVKHDVPSTTSEVGSFTENVSDPRQLPNTKQYDVAYVQPVPGRYYDNAPAQRSVGPSAIDDLFDNAYRRRSSSRQQQNSAGVLTQSNRSSSANDLSDSYSSRPSSAVDVAPSNRIQPAYISCFK